MPKPPWPVRWNEDLASRVMSYVTVFFLSVLVGAAIYEYRIFPSRVLKEAFIGIEALYMRYLASGGAYRNEIWVSPRSRETGVRRHDPERAYQGLTLYTSGHAQKAFLIDMDGRIVHEWSLPFREVWPNPSHVSDPVAPDLIYWRMAHLFPNGDLLAIYIGSNDTPWGYGLARLDKDSNLIWKYDERVHHDLDVDEEGRIYTLVHGIDDGAIRGMPALEPPFVHDFVVVLDPDGEEIKRVSLFEALRDSSYSALYNLFNPMNRRRDFMHSNSVDLVREPLSGPDGSIEAGQLLVSLRDVEAIAAVDLEQEVITWAYRGNWRAQHDPDILENGRFLIFDNRGHIGPGGRSRIVEFDPFTGEVFWEFGGGQGETFFSHLRGRQQPLPNGNILVTETDNGRLFEVTPDKEVVWEYLSPHRGGRDNEFVAVITGGKRYVAESLTFLSYKDSATTAPPEPRM